MVLAFWLSFGITLILLGFAAWSGRSGRRRTHFVVAPAMVLALAVTVWLTEQLVRAREFPPDELAFHLIFAKGAAYLLLPVLVTGLLLVKRPQLRVAHRVCVILFVLAALSATGTGIWVFNLSTPR